MAAAEPTPTTTGMGFLGLLSFRRSAMAVASFDPAQDDELAVLDALQAHVADRLAALSSFSSSQTQGQTLSLGFLSKLLDAVVTSDAAFREALLAVGAAALARHPADRLAADLLDRAVRALDVLNAVSLALASLRGSHRAALAAADCLLLLPATNGKPHRAHFARGRRAISRLFPAAAAAPPSTPCSSRAARALSFSVSSKNWSSSSSSSTGGRHVAALPMPQGPPAAAPGAGCGLGLALYTMSSVLAFAMWALAAAVPCPASAAPLAPPKQAQWAAPMALLQDRIVEESRKKDNNNSKKGSSSGPTSSSSSSGLLAEMQAVERAARELNSLLEEIAEEEEEEDDGEEPEAAAAAGEDRAADVVERAEALAGACRALEDGLAPLERQVRAVFHRVVASRGEVVRCIEQSARSTTTNSGAGPASAGAPPSQHHSF